MSVIKGPNVVREGLVLHLDAGTTRSYPGSGTTWTDLSENSNNGTLVNSPTFNSANGGSIVFDGGDDHATTTLQRNATMTFEAFFRATVSSGYRLIFGSVGSGSDVVWLGKDRFTNNFVIFFFIYRNSQKWL